MLRKRAVRGLVAVLIVLASLLQVQLVLAAPVTTVHLNGDATGFLAAPCNCVASVQVVAHVRGSAGSLEGSGTSHASTGSTNLFPLTGSLNGTSVLLSGTVSNSNAPYLVGSQIQISADQDTGALQFTIVPAAGPYAGQVLVFSGSANVIITGS